MAWLLLLLQFLCITYHQSYFDCFSSLLQFTFHVYWQFVSSALSSPQLINCSWKWMVSGITLHILIIELCWHWIFTGLVSANIWYWPQTNLWKRPILRSKASQLILWYLPISQTNSKQIERIWLCSNCWILQKQIDNQKTNSYLVLNNVGFVKVVAKKFFVVGGLLISKHMAQICHGFS